jgi:hypothetical protein
MTESTARWVRTAVVTVACGMLLVGQFIMLPAAYTQGKVLERISQNERAWMLSHELIAIAAMLMPFAAYAIYTVLREKSPRLAATGLVFHTMGAVALAGQFALDFMYVAISRVQPRETAYLVVDAFRGLSFEQFLYYDVPDLALLIGNALYTIAAIRDPRLRWVGGGLYILAAIVLTYDGFADAPPLTRRIGLAILTLGSIYIASRETKKV